MIAVPAKSANIGAIGGGIAAGVIVFSGLVFLLCWRRRQRKLASYSNPIHRPDLGEDPHPMPYIGGYGQPGLPMAQTSTLGHSTLWRTDKSDASLEPHTEDIHPPPQPLELYIAHPFPYSPITPQTALSMTSHHSHSPGMNADPDVSLGPPGTQDVPLPAETPSVGGPEGAGGTSGGLGVTDIDRIAARVASFVIQSQGPQPIGTQVFDSPPMYREEH